MKQDFYIVSPYNEIIYTEPGKNGKNDMKVLTVFPRNHWPQSLYYIGVCLRLKGFVEDRNYPPPRYRGKRMLTAFCKDCIESWHLSISDICRRYNIPTFTNKESMAGKGEDDLTFSIDIGWLDEKINAENFPKQQNLDGLKKTKKQLSLFD